MLSARAVRITRPSVYRQQDTGSKEQNNSVEDARMADNDPSTQAKQSFVTRKIAEFADEFGLDPTDMAAELKRRPELAKRFADLVIETEVAPHQPDTETDQTPG